MQQVNLAKALQIKNRIVQKIHELDGIVTEHNRQQVGLEDTTVDVRKAWEQRRDAVAYLVNLKLKLQEASDPIRLKIFILGELKAENSVLQSLSLKEGKEREYNGVYGSSAAIVEYSLVLKKAEVAGLIKDNQKAIDKIQDEINEFNYSTMVGIDDLPDYLDVI